VIGTRKPGKNGHYSDCCIKNGCPSHRCHRQLLTFFADILFATLKKRPGGTLGAVLEQLRRSKVNACF
jgi:hypothetical protein